MEDAYLHKGIRLQDQMRRQVSDMPDRRLSVEVSLWKHC